ncbi:MAG: 4-hydroxybenzoate octaprenyltransferase [Pseudomonadota bacterium]
MQSISSFVPTLKKSNLYQYYLLMRLDKPIGSLLLLWPTLWALWIAAEGFPPYSLLIIFTLGVIFMRAAGCVINDYADREVDKHVQRTQQRPLTSGKISTHEALSLFAILILMSFFLVLFLNQLTFFLSIIAIVLAIIYPFMKRYTYYPQFFLGLAFSWSIPMAFAAQTNALPNIAWWLYILTISWIIAYDTMYAMVDREDDLKIGIKSTAIAFGKADKLIIILLQLFTLLGLSVLGLSLGMNPAYYFGIIVALGFSVYQQWLIKERDKSKCFQAFLNNNWFGMSIFLGIFFNYLFI